MNKMTGGVKMKSPYKMLLAVLLLLSACSAEDNVEEHLHGNIPIGFSSNVPKMKATTEYTSGADLKDIGVFAYFMQGDFNAATATPNFMYNQCVTRQEDGTWFYTPIKFWPADGTNKISFFAYAPYTKEGNASGDPKLTIQESTAQGFPTLYYTVPSAENKQIDLLAATPLLNRTSDLNGGIVSFKMNHVLTKVAIYVKSNDNTVGKRITAFSIKGAKSGTLTWHAPVNVNDKGTTWNYPTPVERETFTAAAMDFTVPDSESDEKELLATFFLLPKNEGNTFSITYTAPDASGRNTSVQTITLTEQPLPSLDSWGQGASVSYTFGIDKKKITVKASDNPTWENGSSETIDGTVTDKVDIND